MMEVEFGSSVALCTPEAEYEHILEDILEEGLKKSALSETHGNSNNAISHPIEKATTNVVCIKFADADTNQHMSTGDPTSCSGCRAILSNKSVVTNGGAAWPCEFCGHQNQLQAPMDANEIPTATVTEYLLEPPAAKKDEHAVIFCLDVSGSMDGSRIGTLKSSLDEQLHQLSQTMPDTRVGLIIFNSDVTFFSGVDGSREVIVHEKDKAIDEFDLMAEVAHECKALGKIKDTVGTLRGKVHRLNANGGTALGPALLMGVCVAGCVGAGSQVVICTDGQANVGMGSMRSVLPNRDDRIAAFYPTLAKTAKHQGVSVSVTSFTGTDVSLERLAVLADDTGGKIKIADLNKISKSFGNVVADSVVAWGVEVTRVASKNVKINQEDAKADLGNCVKNSEVTAEFTVDPAVASQEILFQTQVRYTRVTDGARMLKVFTHVLPVTRSRADAEGAANLALLALHAVRMCAKRAQEGEYTRARLNVYAHQFILARIAHAQGKLEDYHRFLEDLEIVDGELRYSERQEEKSGRRERGDRDRDRDRDRRDDRRARRDDRGANVFYQMKSWNTRNMRRSRSRSPPRQRHRSRSRSPSPVRNADPRNRSPVRSASSRRSRSRSPVRNASPRRSRSPQRREDRRDGNRRDNDRGRRDTERDRRHRSRSRE